MAGNRIVGRGRLAQLVRALPLQGRGPGFESLTAHHPIPGKPTVANEIWLVRHGETEWSRSGQHTGRTDLPLTEKGRAQATALAALLSGRTFSAVLTSPLSRATETCRLAGFAAAEADSHLREWDYGAFEGQSTPDIRRQRPEWNLWRDGVPEGETIQEVAARAARVIRRVGEFEGTVAIFGHGHLLRILTACWLGQPPEAARLFALATATVSVLGFEREQPVILRWNQTAGAG